MPICFVSPKSTYGIRSTPFLCICMRVMGLLVKRGLHGWILEVKLRMSNNTAICTDTT